MSQKPWSKTIMVFVEPDHGWSAKQQSQKIMTYPTRRIVRPFPQHSMDHFADVSQIQNPAATHEG